MRVKTDLSATRLSDTFLKPPAVSGATHVVLLVDQLPLVLGGGERVVLRTADLLVRAGYRVSIVTFAILCPPEALAAAVCPVYLLPLTSVFGFAALRAAWQLGRFLRREQVRIVQTYFESSNLFGGIATKAFSRAKLIWNRRDMGILRDRKHRVAYRYLRRLPDAVVAVSQQVRHHAIQVDHVPPERVSVVYNGRKMDHRQQAKKQCAEGLLVVTVGNIRAVKGHDTLIDAAALVLQQHANVRFVIAGEVLEPDFSQRLKERSIQLGIRGHVEFPGAVADPVPLLEQSSIFVLPSRSEGFSNAIVEAMMAGLPVVATEVGGNAEAVVQGETGLLISPNDPVALAAALNSLLADSTLRVRMGNAGRQRAEALFTEESMLQQTVAIFSRVLG